MFEVKKCSRGRKLRRARSVKAPFRAVFLAVFGLALLPFAVCAPRAERGTPGAEQGEPAWVSDPYRVYGKDMYIAAVGYGPNRDSAEKSALAALTAIFGQSVSSSSQSNYTYSQAVERSGSGWTENSDIAQAVKTSVEMDTLIGAEIKDVWDNGRGTVYAVAAMERIKTKLVYSELIQQNLRVISKLTVTVRAERYSFDDYAGYQQAALLADANAVFANVMNVIGPAIPRNDLVSGNNYRQEAAEIARNIPIAVTVENDRQDRVKGAFSKVLGSAGFRTGGKDSRYELRAKLALEQASFDGNPYKWIRYVLDASLVDRYSETILFPYTITGREGHASEAEAANRMLRAVEESIEDSYVKALEEFLSQ
ncbi:MAG: LPP20 family lipoprotein [Treponema sp.]|jgi:hypothetical protein|nr:LPP20 family lipoprotein [Treponema sp.]